MIRFFCAAWVFLALIMPALSLDAEVSALKAALSSHDSTQINNALIQLNGAIGKYEAVDRSSWDKPSPERAQHRHDIIAALGPVTPELVKLIQGADNTVAANATVILGFSGGERSVYEALKTNLKDSSYSSVASPALYSLYQMGKADDEVRAIAVQRIAGYKDQDQSDVAFRLLNLAAVWPLPEALPLCREMINSDAHVRSKIVAVNALMKLGPAAAEALPDLQRFLAQLRSQGGDFRDVNTLDRATRIISGQTDAPSPPAPAPTSVAATPSPATPVPSATPLASLQPTTPDAQTPAPVVERKSPVWPWLVGILAFIAIIAVALKRRAG